MSKHDTVFFTTLVLFLVLSLTKAASPKDEHQMESKEAPKEMTPTDQDDMSDMDIMGALSECNETFRIQMSYLLALNDSGSFPDETDKTPKCYVRCVLEMAEVASADGQFDAARAETALMGIRGVRAMSNVEETAASCAADRKESCKCERSYQFIKCLMEMEIRTSEKS